MSTSLSASAPATSTARSAAEIWRAGKVPLVLGALVLLIGLLTALTAGGRDSGRLDPRSPAPGGARALAEVLRDLGVTVDLVTTAAAMTATVTAADTVLVVDPDLLADKQVDAVLATGGEVVVIGTAAPERWIAGAAAEGAEPGVRGPGCGLAVALRAGPADTGALAYDLSDAQAASAPEAQRCYSRDGTPSLVRVPVDGAPVTLLGSARGLTNDRLDDEGNAALALGLLGARDRLVWYLPSPGDVPPGEERSFYSLVPTAIWWALLQLGIAVLLLAAWRARRLGPVVVEPLPVVVRAAEAVEGRARLYRRAGARGRAAESLRSGARSRLAVALGLPRRAEPAVVVAAVAARCGSFYTAGDVGSLLYGADPADDAALVRLADVLDALEREVRRP